MSKKVSICIPAFNQPESIRHCLESIREQDYRDFEVIITDDSNNDSIGRICSDFTAHFKLRYIKNKISLGAPQNWNKAIDSANGKYIKILFHDDYFTNRQSLGNFVSLLETNKNNDFAFSGARAMDQFGKEIFLHAASKGQVKRIRHCPETLYPSNFIGAPSATIFKNKANLRFDNNLHWVVDLAFYYSILANNSEFSYTTKPLISITVGSSEQLTSQYENNKQVEIYEWLYLYSKLKISYRNNFQHFWFIWRLMDKYKIFSEKELFTNGINFQIPKIATTVISHRQKFRLLLKYHFAQKALCTTCFAYTKIWN